MNKLNLQLIALLGVIGIGLLAWGGSYWFEDRFGNLIGVNPSPTSSATETPTLTPDDNPTQSTTPSNPSEPTATSKPGNSPTSGNNSPTPTLPPEPTPTPPDQNVPVTSTFFEYAACHESDIQKVNQIIDSTESQLVPISREYEDCKAAAEAQSQSCFQQCGFTEACTKTCGPPTDAAYKKCDETYEGKRNPLVNNAISELGKYCPTIITSPQ